MDLTQAIVERLQKVIDPETGADLVRMPLIIAGGKEARDDADRLSG